MTDESDSENLRLTSDELEIAECLIHVGEYPVFVMEQGLEEEYDSLLTKLRNHD